MPPLDDLRERFNLKADTLSQSLTPELLIALSFFAGSGSTILASRLYTRHIKRIRNHDWVTPDMISRKRWLKGLATRGISIIASHAMQIAHVSVKRRFLPWGSSLAVEMLREGMAGVYEQAGAQYGPGGKEEFLRIEAEAKAARRGMWKSGLSGETPAEYKRRYQEGKKVEKAEKAVEEEQVPRKGLFSRLFGR
ncbi:putative endonuclease lcl3 [Paramarasmius palmivorus]|uniref:Endonuclease lcl3 n=1 Tax=Paramarasmius palmivorus TaxID=297713 RepID=A0AAW0BTH8_9AGAR